MIQEFKIYIFQITLDDGYPTIFSRQLQIELILRIHRTYIGTILICN